MNKNEMGDLPEYLEALLKKVMSKQCQIPNILYIHAPMNFHVGDLDKRCRKVIKAKVVKMKDNHFEAINKITKNKNVKV